MLMIESSTTESTVSSSSNTSRRYAKGRAKIGPAGRPTCSVAESLAQVLSGCPRAAAWLYEQFSGELARRLSGRYGHLYGEPEDLLQDAFLFYFQNDCKVLRDFVRRVPPAAQTHARLATTLWDLACGLVANRRRASQSRNRVFDPMQSADEVETVDNGFEHQAVLRDELRRLESHLSAECPNLAVYCRLRFTEGYSPTEIARLTGWPPRVTYKLRQELNRVLSSFAAGAEGPVALPA